MAHILIIEDNDMSFVLADVLLRKAGHTIGRATDGAAGVQAALANTADLILCDLDLPVMSGHDVAASLNGHPEWRRVPLLAFTADTPDVPHNSGVSQNELLAAGFAGFVTKPVDPRTFPSLIARYVSA